MQIQNGYNYQLEHSVDIQLTFSDGTVMSNYESDEQIDAICDRFESVWASEGQPCIDQFLLEVDSSKRDSLLYFLLILDIQYRRQRGQTDIEINYAGLFPNCDQVVQDAVKGLKPETQGGEINGAGDRNLLYGILALQFGFIHRDALIEAMSAWVIEKASPLASILVRSGHLTAEKRSFLDSMIEQHLKLNQGNADNSLRSLSSFGSVREELAKLGDEDIDASLAQVPIGPANWISESETIDIGESSSLGKRFRVIRAHAKGGLGEVFVARDLELNREVALKQIQQRFADDTDRRARFQLEAEVTGSLEHPGIVPVYGLGKCDNGRPFYAMRMVRGDSLKEAIEAFHNSESPDFDSVSFRKLLARFIDICDAIHYAHSRGVLHRDLKPGNIMLGKFGETLVVDWGLAKVAGRQSEELKSEEGTLQPGSGSGVSPTAMGIAFGTPGYMSPEQAAGQIDELGTATDVFSLGATFYSVLIGRPPFQGTDVAEILENTKNDRFSRPREHSRRVPAALESICLKAMRKIPGERYPTVERMKDDVESWLADAHVSAHRENFLERCGRWMRRNRQWVATAGLAVVLLVLSTLIATAVVNSFIRKADADMAELLRNGHRYQLKRREAQEQLMLRLKREPPTAEQQSLAISYEAFEGISAEEKEGEDYQPPLINLNGTVCHRDIGMFYQGKVKLNETWFFLGSESESDVKLVCVLTPWDENMSVDGWIGRQVSAFCYEHENWRYRPRFNDKEESILVFIAGDLVTLRATPTHPPDFVLAKQYLERMSSQKPEKKKLLFQVESDPPFVKRHGVKYDMHEVNNPILQMQKTMDEYGVAADRFQIVIEGTQDDDCVALAALAKRFSQLDFSFSVQLVDKEKPSMRPENETIESSLFEENSPAMERAKRLPEYGFFPKLIGDKNFKKPRIAEEERTEVHRVDLRLQVGSANGRPTTLQLSVDYNPVWSGILSDDALQQIGNGTLDRGLLKTADVTLYVNPEIPLRDFFSTLTFLTKIREKENVSINFIQPN